MKKIALFSLVAALLGSGFVSTASAQLRIGTVDMKRVFDSYYKTKEAEQKINEKRNEVKKELEDRLEIYKKAVGEVQKLDEDAKRSELSASARDAKQKELSDRLGRLNATQREDNDFRASREKDLQDMSLRLRAVIVDDITRVVMDRVKSEQYDLVLDSTGASLNNVPVVMYSKESYDFTPEVVTALNKTRGTAETVRPAEVVRPAATPKKPK